MFTHSYMWEGIILILNWFILVNNFMKHLDQVKIVLKMRIQARKSWMLMIQSTKIIIEI